MKTLNFIKHKEYIENNIDYSVIDNNNYYQQLINNNQQLINNYKYLLEIINKKLNNLLILSFDNNKLIINLPSESEFKTDTDHSIDFTKNNKYLISDINLDINSNNKKILNNNECYINEYIKIIYKDNKIKIITNKGYMKLFILISSNNIIEKITIYNNISICSGSAFYYKNIDVFIENISTLKKIKCIHCNIINFSNNILKAELTDLFYCDTIKKIKLHDTADDSSFDIDGYYYIKISDIITKFPNIKKLKLSELLHTMFDKSINLNKLCINIPYFWSSKTICENLIINNNCNIYCKKLIINIYTYHYIYSLRDFTESLKIINYFLKDNLTIKCHFYSYNIIENKNNDIKEKINCNKLIIYYRNNKLDINNENYNYNKIFNYNEILFINK